MATRWCTMEDVQADLARATGQRTRAPLLHEGCLLHGERPPPRHAADEEECEEEQQLRYGAAAGRGGTGTGPATPLHSAPDLRGITSMLRMVQNYGSDESTQNLTTSDEVIVISKLTPKSPRPEPTQSSESKGSASWMGLNPNAKSFVPKTPSPIQSERKIGSSEGINTADKSDKLETNNNMVSKAEGNEEQRSAEFMTDEQRLQREELAAMLQIKIQASSPDCPRRQHERYAAIAGLLRLHSAPPAPLTLRTPDYFRNHRAEPLACGSRGAELLVTETGADTHARAATPDERELRASISKVSAWLHAPAPAPAPAAPAPAAPLHPHLGPLSYRRRGGAATPSPTRGARARPADVSYVPSANAVALSEQYAARVASAPAPPRSLWERLEEDMRAQEARRAAAEDGS